MYTISNEKLQKVVKLFNEEVDPAATDELVKGEICADWNEGNEHQQWIDNADEKEIVQWLASFYS